MAVVSANRSRQMTMPAPHGMAITSFSFCLTGLPSCSDSSWRQVRQTRIFEDN